MVTSCIWRLQILLYFLSIQQGCGKDLTMIEKDTSRVRYLSPEEGVEYGLIDKVLYPAELRVQVSGRIESFNHFGNHSKF